MLVDESTLNLWFGLFLFAFGACIGSFLNVVAYRLPLGLSLIRPPSHCPKCSTPVPVYGLVPIFGFAFVRGRCVACETRVSIAYPLVELICALGTVFLFFSIMTPLQFVGTLWPEAQMGTHLGMMRYQPLVLLLTRFFLFYTAIPLTLIDLRHRILPDVITLTGALCAILLGAANVMLGWKGALGGALLGSGLLFFIAKTYELLRGQEGLGLGDVKYMALIGAVVGWQGVLIVLGLASILGSVVGIAIGLGRRTGLQTSVPFGPFLAVAALIVCLWQPFILQIFFDDL
ncbi:prepilin peptidase [bacterium]|nr:prepilin peptidase [bacterium]